MSFPHPALESQTLQHSIRTQVNLILHPSVTPRSYCRPSASSMSIVFPTLYRYFLATLTPRCLFSARVVLFTRPFKDEAIQALDCCSCGLKKRDHPLNASQSGNRNEAHDDHERDDRPHLLSPSLPRSANRSHLLTDDASLLYKTIILYPNS